MPKPDHLFPNRAPTAQPSRPTLVVVVDTEEEFDWNAPFSRLATAVSAMRHIDRTQRLCEAAKVVPTYVIDYPVATKREGHDQISAWARAGRCEIGAHLHPWVNPPFEESLGGPNSYTCNLPPVLQRAKMQALCDAIAVNTTIAPTVFKAGRYGIGQDALGFFPELGLAVDTSVNPCMNFSADGGPDFSMLDARAFWIDRARGILEVPCTHGFVGWARRHGRRLRNAAEMLQALSAPGVLSRTGAVNRVMLSPEGNTLDEMIALTRALLDDGVKLFALTFHSPSVVPGHTPYVRSQADLAAFLHCIEGYFEFFFGDLSGEPSTVTRYRQQLSHA